MYNIFAAMKEREQANPIEGILKTEAVILFLAVAAFALLGLLRFR